MNIDNLRIQRENILMVEKLFQKNVISKLSRDRLIIAIDYYYSDVTYENLALKYRCGVKKIKLAMNDPIVEEIMGEEFFQKLKQKKNTHKHNKEKVVVETFSKEHLELMKKIENPEIGAKTPRELNMLKAAMYYIKHDGNCSYKEIAEFVGCSKSSISLYFNDENLKKILKEEYYIQIKISLESKTPAPSKSITSKKQVLQKMINYIKSISYDTSNLDELSMRKMSRELSVDYLTLKDYLNDNLFQEMVDKDSAKHY